MNIESGFNIFMSWFHANILEAANSLDCLGIAELRKPVVPVKIKRRCVRG